MAVFRFRRNRIFVAFLLACLLYIVYLFYSLPPKGDLMAFPGQAYPGEEFIWEKAKSKKLLTTTHHLFDNLNNVLAPPHLLSNKKMDSSSVEGQHLLRIVGGGQRKANNSVKKTSTESDHSDHVVVDQAKQELKAVDRNKTAAKQELAQNTRNRTLDVEEEKKNKTLKQIAVIGAVASQWFPQLVFAPKIWNLTISFEDLGDLLKETQFLNKVDPLNLKGPILVSSRNRTANFSYAMPLNFGFCDCFDHYCVCCSQIVNKRLHLNVTACSNFTFVSKTHELDLRFSLDGKPVHKSLISADKSPLLCMGSVPKVADICVHFFNMTYRVNEHNGHQTQLLGCTDVSLNLYNKTIGAFPVDCFQIPGDPDKVHKERVFNMMPNWVP